MAAGFCSDLFFIYSRKHKKLLTYLIFKAIKYYALHLQQILLRNHVAA